MAAVGSIEAATDELYVVDADSGKLVKRSITYVPALLKIFDEVLVNVSVLRRRRRGGGAR